MYFLNFSPRASQQGLERGAVSQLQQLDQWQLELGCQRPVSALHTVPTSFQRYQQELPALVPGWWCQWGCHREHALHVWGPHTSEAKGKDGCSCPAARSRIKFTCLMSYPIKGSSVIQVGSVVFLTDLFSDIGEYKPFSCFLLVFCFPWEANLNNFVPSQQLLFIVNPTCYEATKLIYHFSLVNFVFLNDY